MILVDFREKDSIVPSELEKLGIPIKVMQNDIGDYIITGSEIICVERKETHDFVQSLTSGHLNNQLVAMSQAYAFTILLVEGTVSMALIDSGVKRNVYLSALMGSIVKRSPNGESGTVSVVCVETAYDTALCLKFLHDKNQDPQGLIRLPKLKTLEFGDEDYVLGMLCAIPGVGPKLGKGILEKFHTIQNVAGASLEELMTVEKVGKVKAEEIFRFFRYYYKN